MQHNVGPLDRSIRITLSITAFSIYKLDFFEPKSNLLFVGLTLALIITGLLSYCPIYTFLHYTSVPQKDTDD